jgi:glyoxylase-like metal-dependent hydrolase (beta-lactamase superfamily II)
MQAKKPIDLGNRIHLIDGFDLGRPSRTGTYVMDEENLTLIETGPSPSVPYIREGLTELGFKLEDVKYIIVTHIHLDHAGGTGLFLQECPNAQVVVHPKGARHLADPTRLVAGAKAVYSANFDALFDPVVAVPEERLLTKDDGDTLSIGADCTLEFLDTPGHAKHHFSIYDPVSNGMFTGDTAGIRYELLANEGNDFFLPTTTPNHFDPEEMLHSINRIRKQNVDRVYFGHFGMTENIEEAFRQVSEWLPVFVEEGKRVLGSGKGVNELTDALIDRLRNHLESLNVKEDHEIYEILQLDMQVCAMGIVDYLQKQQ